MIVIVLPAFNEETTIIPLVNNILAISKKRLVEGVKIIVVDDGSSDTTAACVRAINSTEVILVQHTNNKGLGEALKTGLLYGLNLSSEVDTIITMDSDNTHSPGLILRMIMALEEGNDLVIASRYQPGSRIIGLTVYRQMLSLCMSYLFRLLFPIHGVRDYSCGYRAYRAQLLRDAFALWKDAFITQSGFGCMADILLKLDRLGAIMIEVPLILHYDNKRGKSKMKIMKTIRETLVLAYHEKAERLKNKMSWIYNE